MTLRLPFFLALLLLASCEDFPKDTEGTLKRVQAEGSFRVGLVAPLGKDAKAEALLQRIGRAAGATPRLEVGDAEPLLNRLEEGDLDLVIGRFEAKSPWRRLVSFSPPLRREMHGKVEFYLAAAARNVAPEAQ